jgi:hypothetical protein
LRSGSIDQSGGHHGSLKRSTRQNSFEFETVRPEQKILTADEKVRELLIFFKFRKSLGSRL